HRAVADAEGDGKRFEGAAIPIVPEAGPEHVEGQRIASGLDVSDESKPRLRIDETPDQPRRGHPIDAGSRTSHPETAIVLPGIATAAYRLGAITLGGRPSRRFKVRQ